MNSALLFVAQLAARRGELELRAALGKVLYPEVFRPEVAEVVKDAWTATRKAEGVIHWAVVTTERPENVIDMAAMKARRRDQVNQVRPGGKRSPASP